MNNELIERIEHLADICHELANGNNDHSISQLKPAVQFYTEFLKYFHLSSSTNKEDYLSMIQYLIEQGNTTVYQWRTGGNPPVSVERPALNYKFAETIQINETDNQDQTNIILDLDDDQVDLTASIEGIEIKQTSEQTDTIDFGTVII